MANRREEERERLRQARQEREKKQTGSERRRLMIGYGVAGLVGLAVLAGIVAIIVSAANKNDSGEAHIVQATGSTNGIQPDERSGTTAAGAESDQPAEGGKEGRLRPSPQPSERGPHPHPADGADAGIQNQPADLGQPRRTSVPAGRRRLQGNAVRKSTSSTRWSTAGWRSSTARTSPKAPSWN